MYKYSTPTCGTFDGHHFTWSLRGYGFVVYYIKWRWCNYLYSIHLANNKTHHLTCCILINTQQFTWNEGDPIVVQSVSTQCYILRFLLSWIRPALLHHFLTSTRKQKLLRCVTKINGALSLVINVTLSHCVITSNFDWLHTFRPDWLWWKNVDLFLRFRPEWLMFALKKRDSAGRFSGSV